LTLFDKQDTTALKSMVTQNMILQSISTSKEGQAVLKEDYLIQFVKNIASIPKDRKFEEKLFNFSIQVDGNMANAFTPCEFWYQEKLSHC
jgi:hypothetical protein